MDRVQEVISRILGIWWRNIDREYLEDIRWFWDGKESYYYSIPENTFSSSSFTPESMDGHEGYERTSDPRICHD
jgi:hypothetical protein